MIECDGPVHQPNEQWHHDQNRDAYMIAQGLRVLRFTNDRILTHTENVLDEIASFLPSPTGRGAGGEGLIKERQTIIIFAELRPSPNPLPEGEGSKL